MVADTFGADDEAVANNLDLTPDDGVVVGGEATKVLELAILGDLGEGGTVSLTDGNEVSALVRPTPGTTSLANSITELLVRLEVVHVDVLAL